MNIGVKVRELSTGSIGSIEKGNDAGGWYVNFGARKAWKKSAEIEIVGRVAPVPPSNNGTGTTTTTSSVPKSNSEEPVPFRPPKKAGGNSLTGPGGKYSTLPSKAFFDASNDPPPRSGPSESFSNMMKQFGQQQQSSPNLASKPTGSVSTPSNKARPGIPDFSPPPPTAQPPKPTPITTQKISPPPSNSLTPVPPPRQVPVPVQQPVQVVQQQPSTSVRGAAATAGASSSSSPSPATTPTSNAKDMWHINFNELEIGDVIGQGKYGEVSLGSYLGTPVAIKRILECNEETNIMIERELQILKEVRHPNIVQFLGATTQNNEIYIITEFMESGDLFDTLIFGDNPLSWKKKLGIALDVAQACTYLQARGILHRDLKSQNILLSSNMKAKLCDLGLARAFDSSNKRLTFVGSDRWMAPEIFMGMDYDHKADVFSYGIVLVEMITGQVPDERKPMKRFAFEKEAFLNKVPEDCPADFTKLTVQCCSTDPRERPTFKKILDIVKGIYESTDDEEYQ